MCVTQVEREKCMITKEMWKGIKDNEHHPLDDIKWKAHPIGGITGTYGEKSFTISFNLDEAVLLVQAMDGDKCVFEYKYNSLEDCLDCIDRYLDN